MTKLWLFALVMLVHAPIAAHAAAIHDAARKGDTIALVAALDGGADANESDGLVTPLYAAATKGYVEAARILINRGADVNLSAKFGTPLFAAAKFGQAEIVVLLLANGAKPNQSSKSLIALHVAADSGCLACVKSLVEAGADVNALTSERQPAIHFAKRNGYQDIAAYLRTHGAERPVLPSVSAQIAKADLQSGKQLFRKICAECHTLLKEVQGTFGPGVWGVVGRKRASIENFDYSQALREEGGRWTYDELNVFISDPTRAIPGTRMQMAGLREEKQRTDIIAYLRMLSDQPLPLPAE